MGDAIAMSNYIITNENGVDHLERSLETMLGKLRSIDGDMD
jgi:hypothetical protein